MSKSYRLFLTRAKTCLAALALAGAVGPALANQFQNNVSVPPGAVSPPITIYGVNTPVSFTCVSNTPGYRGVGQMTILRPNPAQFLEWVGLDIATGQVSTGYSGTSGTHMIWCSFTDELVEVQVLNDNQIQIMNHAPNTVTVTGVINQIW